MTKPEIPLDELYRLETLRSLNILDTPPEERFDRLTRIAKRIFGVPIALVSLIDENRQWFKSRDGLSVTETPRDISFCGHAILGEETFIIPDAKEDDRFMDNPLVLGEPQIRFYAGHPIKASNGQKLGTLCIIDQKPRNLSREDLEALGDLVSILERELAAIELATRDELTNIPNRRGFITLAQYSLDLCARQNIPVSLVFLDLDNFKGINDKFGHSEGDHALSIFADLMKHTFRNSDILARLGGDEFLVLLPNSSKKTAEDVIARLSLSVGRHNQETDHGYELSFSHGVIELDPEKHDTIEELIADADSLMYTVKNVRR